ncbi:MAG: divalent-cation tolerance protein CutA, partial [Thiohalobacteraceae bacterium]
MTDAYCIVLCTVPDPDTGERLAAGLVEARVAACVNILPGLTSVFRWRGETQKDPEALLIIKTRRDRFDDLCKVLREQHPY